MVFYCGSRYSSVLKVLLELHVLWSHIFISEAASYYVYHICDNSTTYTPNSTYQINLNSLLSTLSSPNITRNNLFYNATAGSSASDRAYGLFICRGDVDIRSCHECVENAAREVVEKCPKEKQAYIWYNECRLRYDNKSFFSTMDVSHRWYMWNEAKVTEPDRLSQVLNNSLRNLAARACKKQSTTNGGQLKGFAIGETSFINSTLYSLVQCTPDLSEADCNRCLGVAIGLMPSCCWGKQGGKVLLPSCNIRYEMYPFYNIIAAPPQSTILPPAPRSSKNQRGIGRISAQVIIIIVVAVVVSIFVFTLGFCFLRRRRAKRFDAIQEATGRIQESKGFLSDENEILIAESLQYDLSTVGAATNYFSAENKVGEGGFGEVFKGTLPNGLEIAVKRLSKRSGQGVQEFKNEVAVVAKLQHRNLVRLVGFCLEQEEKILIYEFVPNKSLDYFLFDAEKRQLLDWSLRYKIIGGIAQGILYLHEHSRLRIIHRDLKASNVLLDGDMNPKISDFGMARTFGVDQSQANTNRIVGTFGYMAPEYAMHGKFSIKSDVFSFGVLILEIISGKKNNSFYQLGGWEDLLSHAWKCWKDGIPQDLVDPTLGDSVIGNEVIRCIHIGLLCVQENADERPTMTLVVLMLNSFSVPLPLPHQPAFFVRRKTESMLKQEELDSKSTPWSANEVSISELYPR